MSKLPSDSETGHLSLQYQLCQPVPYQAIVHCKEGTLTSNLAQVAITGQHCNSVYLIITLLQQLVAVPAGNWLLNKFYCIS